MRTIGHLRVLELLLDWMITIGNLLVLILLPRCTIVVGIFRVIVLFPDWMITIRNVVHALSPQWTNAVGIRVLFSDWLIAVMGLNNHTVSCCYLNCRHLKLLMIGPFENTQGGPQRMTHWRWERRVVPRPVLDWAQGRSPEDEIN